MRKEEGSCQSMRRDAQSCIMRILKKKEKEGMLENASFFPTEKEHNFRCISFNVTKSESNLRLKKGT